MLWNARACKTENMAAVLPEENSTLAICIPFFKQFEKTCAEKRIANVGMINKAVL